MRSALIGFIIGGLTFGLTGAAVSVAAPSKPGEVALHALLAPRAGNKACYVRSYDATHLRVHPRQRITAMRFLLSVEAHNPKPAKVARPEDLVYYTFTMSVTRRGDKWQLRASGDCQGGSEISCVVDCDGGGVKLDKLPPAGSLIVRLQDDGIRMLHDCDDEEGVLVKPGTDDKMFRLDKAANDVCRALEQRQ